MNPKIVAMSPTVATKSHKQQEGIWQQYDLCLAVAILGGKHFLILGPETVRVWQEEKIGASTSTTCVGPCQLEYKKKQH